MESGALVRLAEAIDEVFATDLDPRDEDSAIAAIRGLERQVRRLQAAQVELLDVIDRRVLYHRDGHGSAKVMVRHVARLSGAEAAARARSARALRHLPAVAEAHRSGAIGTCQVRRVARAHANPRVREWLPHSDGHFVDAAATRSYEAFDELVTDWVRRVDEDGTCDTNQRNNDNRDLRVVQDFDQSWHLEGGCASLQGAQLHEVLDHQVEAELLADWEKARAEHGDAATVDDLPRTPGQRRFDAFFELVIRGSASTEGGVPQVVTNVVIDETTFERMVVRLAGGEPPPADPHDERYRCSTIDGHPVEPTEAVAAALVGHVRRVVVGADSVAIDLGRKQRLFTGSARLAVQLADPRCLWPGCHVPVSSCQIDHTRSWDDHGPTSPRNGAPLCGRHNRHKERGFTAWRDPTGQWFVQRPDGVRLE